MLIKPVKMEGKGEAVPLGAGWPPHNEGTEVLEKGTWALLMASWAHHPTHFQKQSLAGWGRQGELIGRGLRPIHDRHW